MQRKAMLEMLTGVLTIILIIFLVVALLLLGKIMSRTITYNDRAGKSDTALYAMLNSNNCTPATKLPFKDILAIGIGEGVIGAAHSIYIQYGGTEENMGLLLPPGITVGYCLGILEDIMLLPKPYVFYVEYPTCPAKADEHPSGVRKCFWAYGGPPTGNPNVLNVESVEYIVLPNGNLAKAVLLTKDVY